jgi:glucosyl-3-phosphoglycerate synthase
MTHIALFVPALNEEVALHRTCAVMRSAVDGGVVNSAFVLDGGSTDASADVAASCGVDVLHVPSLMPSLGSVLGKGDSLFRAVHSVDADWYVFLDADLGNVSLDHVRALVAPIASADSTGVQFVKGGFVRVDEYGVPRKVPGGRVTEQVGRPLLRSVDPALAELSQPLSGQVAIAAGLARSLQFVTGYGIEIAMLIDVYRTAGMAGIVEADMGLVNNRWKPDSDLANVINEVTAGAAMRGVMNACAEPFGLPVLVNRG